MPGQGTGMDCSLDVSALPSLPCRWLPSGSPLSRGLDCDPPGFRFVVPTHHSARSRVLLAVPYRKPWEAEYGAWGALIQTSGDSSAWMVVENYAAAQWHVSLNSVHMALGP